METHLLVSSSPHIRGDDSVNRIMWTVAAALIPACAAAIFYYGAGALTLILMTVACCMGFEAAILAFRRQNPRDAFDGSAAVTGVLLALIMPASSPWYFPVVGSLVAMGLGKHVFGGLGYNIWNPALIARAVLQLAYPSRMNLSGWPQPGLRLPAVHAISGASPDATSQASPLAKEMLQKMMDKFIDRMDTYAGLLVGGLPGSMGETCRLLILVGGIILICLKIVDWRVPVFYILTVFVLVALLPPPEAAKSNSWLSDPIYHCLTGGLMIGAFFMATDMVTTPITRKGRMIFAAGCGLLTVLIRFYTAFPEGVCYAILLMNTATPLIDRFTRPKVFGYVKPPKKDK
ncbi:MAG TPA: RnfABCDGE type electron transport complex subunit D [Candidatus Brocadiia bacterium]|nr:RnfABCDGE type electron transport complex subunit D [Candidatus Brocadiia bacterium]